MKLLVVGGGGYVGSILDKTLEHEHICYHFDRKPIPGKVRSVVADVTDPVMAHRAVQEMDGVLYMPLGVRPGTISDVGDPGICFSVHVLGFYLFLRAGLEHGVRRFIYVSSMGVYGHKQTCEHPITAQNAATGFNPYALSKRLGEMAGEAAVQRVPDATVVAARLCLPRHDRDWPDRDAQTARANSSVLARHPLGPNDTRRLFQALLAFDQPGFHIINAAGDPSGQIICHAKTRQLLGWQPQGD